MKTYRLPLFTLCLLLCLSFPINSQVKNGVYKATKIEKGKESSDIIYIRATSLGNGVIAYTEQTKDEKKPPLNGVYHFEINGDRRHIIGNFSKGLAEGEWTEYMYSDVFRIYNFKNGKLDGETYKVGDDGSKYEISTYKDGLIRHYITYHPNGQQEEERLYDEEGKKHGKVAVYNKEGELVKEANYNHGYYHGQQMEVKSNGSKEIETYNDGILEGEYLLYHPNGNKAIEGSYKTERKKEGTWTYWHENGDIEKTENYLNGKLNGEKKTFYEGGLPRSIEAYTDGELNGKKIDYDEETNKIVAEASYVNGKLDGEFKAYHNGTIWRESLYKEGTMLREKEYKNGKLNVLRLIDDSGRMVDVQEYDATGKTTKRNKDYKKPASITLKEDASGIIDIE